MLGLLRDGNGKAINILHALEVDLEHLRRKVEILSPANPSLAAIANEKKNLHLTRQAERALKTTFLEAKLFQSSSINTAHLLLCILRNENDPTTKLLNRLKVDYDNVKEQFKYMLTSDDDYLEGPSANHFLTIRVVTMTIPRKTFLTILALSELIKNQKLLYSITSGVI